ncbi:MAG: hypothetical protein HYX57_10340 [Chloroflexi bacterium]|nr:hypothetical protein [Chloroflexota bacterium]
MDAGGDARYPPFRFPATAKRTRSGEAGPGSRARRGVTKRVAIPAQAQLNGDRIEIVGSLTFPFSDFAMTPPDIANFVQVEDDATLEVLLSLVKA